MLPANPFLRPAESYIRDINILDHCQMDHAFYLHKETGDPIEECLAFVRQATAPDGILPMTDPLSLVLCRDSGEDKVMREMPLSQFFNIITEKEYIISPSMAVYCSTKEEESLLASFMIVNTEKRAIAKKEMFEADIAGDLFKKGFKDTEQTAKKLANNSLSGAQVSDSTPLYDKSAHSSLTTTCRTATSYGNGYNDGFLAGNRHYWCPDIIISDIIVRSRHANLDKIAEAVSLYKLYLPTAADAMDLVRYNTIFYPIGEQSLKDIESLLTKLTPLERAAYVYVNDIYHLNKYNQQFVHTFIKRLSAYVPDKTIEDPDTVIKALDDDLKAFVGILCGGELMGTSIKNLKKDNPANYQIVAATALNVITVLDKYKLLIETFWMTPIMPPTVAHIRGLIRRAVTTSDTDSSLFTNQFWTFDILGKRVSGREADRISSAMTYLTMQGVAHVLAQMSANIGSDPRHLRRVGMKNEYHFPVFAITPRAKHYYALQGAREGNVYEHMETEIKGVELRSSVVPAHVMKKQKKFIEMILNDALKKGEISLYDLLDEVALVEQGIINSVIKGGDNYFPAGKIKESKSYKNAESAPNYQHYLLWEAVFAPKYGHAPKPEYTCIKVAVNIEKPAAFKKWILTMEDRAVADRLEKWALQNNKKGMGQLLLPAEIVLSRGIPAEIVPVIDLRRLIMNNVSGFYLAMEGLGLYFRDPNICRLISDEYTPRITESKLV